MKTLSQIREASGGKEAYQKFFNSLLKKFGVDSPSELKGDKKKKFFDALDSGWDGDNEKPEAGDKKNEAKKVKPPKQGDRDEYYRRVDKVDKAWGIGAGKKSLSDLSKGDLKKYFADRDKALGHDIFDSVQETTIMIGEKVKAGKGNIKDVGVDLDATDYDGGEKQYMKDVKKKFKVTIKLTRYGAELSGKKQDIVDFMMSDMYGGVDQRDIEDMWPDLMEIYDDPDNLDPDTTKNPDEDEIEEAANSAQLKKAQAIATKNSGDMAAAIKAIEKIKRGLSDDKKVMDMLKRANESTVKISKWHSESNRLWYITEMTAEVEFDWDSYGWNKRKHDKLVKKWKLKVTPMSMKGPGGVDVDHFAKVVGKKENIRGWMKDWNYDYDADEYKQMGLGLKGESVSEANRYRKVLNKPSQIIMALVMKDIHRNRTTDPKEIDAVVDDIAGVSLTDKEVAQVKLAIRHEDVNEAMSKGELKHDKEFMHKKLKGNNNKAMHITTADKLDGVSMNGRHVEWSGKVDKLMSKHKVTIRNDRDGDVSVWGKGDDVHKFLADVGMKTEGVSVDRRTIGFKEAMKRRAEAKKKREAAKIKAAKGSAKKAMASIDANYAYDGDIEEIIRDGNKKLFGEDIANNAGDGHVDMNPDGGKLDPDTTLNKKKKKTLSVIKRTVA
jgi:hypothetical protein|tara:strand:- start:3239 stop:5233 length:1995 start_codon:yes stop_codon:yes gene_type:complete